MEYIPITPFQDDVVTIVPVPSDFTDVFYEVRTDNSCMGYYSLRTNDEAEARRMYAEIVAQNNDPQWPWKLYRMTITRKNELIAA